MRVTILLALAFVALLAIAKIWLSTYSPGFTSSADSPSDSIVTEDSSQGGKVAQAIQELVKGPAAPGIVSSVWLNSPPLTTQNLHGKVVVVEFWTHG